MTLVSSVYFNCFQIHWNQLFVEWPWFYCTFVLFAEFRKSQWENGWMEMYRKMLDILWRPVQTFCMKRLPQWTNARMLWGVRQIIRDAFLSIWINKQLVMLKTAERCTLSWVCQAFATWSNKWTAFMMDASDTMMWKLDNSDLRNAKWKNRIDNKNST